MKVLLESLHLNVHTQEFIQISYNHINQIKAGLGVKGLNTICIIIQN